MDAEDVLSMIRRQSLNKKLLISEDGSALLFQPYVKMWTSGSAELKPRPQGWMAGWMKGWNLSVMKNNQLKKMPSRGFPSHNYCLFEAFQWNRVSMFSISRVAFAQRRIRDRKPRVEAAVDRNQLERPLTLRLNW